MSRRGSDLCPPEADLQRCVCSLTNPSPLAVELYGQIRNCQSCSFIRVHGKF